MAKDDKALFGGKDKVEKAAVIENERANFKTLLLKNPNHFGNLPNLGFKPVKALSQDRSYEELTCLGLHPEGNRLQAVVNVKKHGGYGGGTCTEGSIEYVRFFVRRGAAWHDLGVSTFTSHDLPAGSPLPVSYSVEIDMNEVRKYCTVENIAEVRGILSWNYEPPAGDPNWIPVWGNVLDARVQIAPKSFFKIPLKELISDKLLTIDPSILELINLEETVKPKPDPAPLSYAALKAKYQGKDVPGHRSGFTEVQKLIQRPLSATALIQAARSRAKPEGKTAASADLGSAVLTDLSSIFSDLPSFIDEWLKTKGDRTFEELDCAGYNPETRMLSGVISIKRNSGYSGDLCDPGSTEYVGFWAFHGGSWHSLGMAQVQVHDLAAISPGHPVRYAVFRPANLPEHLCKDIQGLPLRAILSWNTPPTGPDFIPVWGNVVDTHVQPIITDVPVGDHRVRLMRINRVTISKIDANGLAQPSDIAGDCTNGNDSPFGGPLYIEGDITLKSDAFFDPVTGNILPGQHPPAYKVFVRKEGSAIATQLVNSFNIAVFPVNPPIGNPAVTVTQAIQTFGSDQLYLYREGVIQAVNPRTLAVWEAGGFEDGKYIIEVHGFVWSGGGYAAMATPIQTQRVHLYNGYLHTELDANGNSFAVKRPEVKLHITSPSGDCGDVKVGDTITGTYEVNDEFFGSLGIALVPITIGNALQPINPVIPSGPTVYPAAGTHGTSGTWTLSTAGMTPCGYTVVLNSMDRALIGDSCLGHYNQVGVGFCLRKP